MVEVAKELLSQPGGLAELGLPTTMNVPGKAKPIVMDAKAWAILFDEWNNRKEGLPPHEVFGKPRHQKFEPDQSIVNMLMALNIVKTEACFKAALRKTIMVQGTDLMKFKNALKDAKAANDTEAAAIIELKMKEILLSQAAVWNRMSRDQQNLMLKEMPPEADWWLAIAAVEGLKEKSGQPAPTPTHPERVLLDASAGRNLERAFLDESPEDVYRRIKTLQERAKSEPPPKLMNTSPEVAQN